MLGNPVYKMKPDPTTLVPEHTSAGSSEPFSWNGFIIKELFMKFLITLILKVSGYDIKLICKFKLTLRWNSWHGTFKGTKVNSQTL